MQSKHVSDTPSSCRNAKADRTMRPSYANVTPAYRPRVCDRRTSDRPSGSVFSRTSNVLAIRRYVRSCS